MNAPHHPAARSAAPAKPATYQDVLDAPPHTIAEIVGGVLHLQPRPASPHARASSVLGRQIGGPFDDDVEGADGWWILDEPELHLGHDVLVPDLAGWRRARMPELPVVAWFDLAPDWVCEVLSPSTGRLDRTAKMDAYGRAGVGHVWLVDPALRLLEAFASRDGAWVRLAALGGEAEVKLLPFEAVGFALARLWVKEAGP